MSIKYRALDENRDYMLGENSAKEFLTGTDAVAQSILTRLNLLEEEWWEDLDEGLPLFQQMTAQRDKELAEMLITARILETKDVLRVSDVAYSYNPGTRSFHYSCTVTTAYGDIAWQYPMNN